MASNKWAFPIQYPSTVLILFFNSVVIKSTVFPEWNTNSLPEWYAYVPSKMDYSDLFSIMTLWVSAL